MRRVGRVAVAVGVAGIVAAVVVGFWPLHANGVSGSGFRPHYAHYFGFTTYGPLPDNPTLNDLRRAGVRLPMDAVADRRQHMYDVFAGAVLLCVAGAAASLRVRTRSPRT